VKPRLPKLSAPAWLVACAAASVGCYPAYPPPSTVAASREYQPVWGDTAPQEPLPAEPEPPAAAGGIDPGVAIAGAVAAGLLGYAIGNNRGYHAYPYFGPGFHGPVPFGYRRLYFAPPCH
jgi:hypothetical protein